LLVGVIFLPEQKATSKNNTIAVSREKTVSSLHHKPIHCGIKHKYQRNKNIKSIKNSETESEAKGGKKLKCFMRD
jgi:hypothetical protein